jgi:pimeloyl-ACP methyl ester carboxylesterase
MARTLLCLLVLFLVVTPGLARVSGAELYHSVDQLETTYESPAGTSVPGHVITLWVHEDRRSTSSRIIPLRLLRLHAATPSGRPPILFVASLGEGTAEDFLNRHWSLIDRLRRKTDVVLIDPRARGWSAGAPPCRSFQKRDTQAARAHCIAYWEASGYDVDAYSRDAVAGDLIAAATVLGEKVTLLAEGSASPAALLAMAEQERLFERGAVLHPTYEDRVGPVSERGGLAVYEALPTLVRASLRSSDLRVRGRWTRAIPWVGRPPLPKLLVLTGTDEKLSAAPARRMSRPFRRRRSVVVVRNSGSDPLRRSPAAQEELVRFLGGAKVPSQTLAVAPPQAAPSGA